MKIILSILIGLVNGLAIAAPYFEGVGCDNIDGVNSCIFGLPTHRFLLWDKTAPKTLMGPQCQEFYNKLLEDLSVAEKVIKKPNTFHIRNLTYRDQIDKNGKPNGSVNCAAEIHLETKEVKIFAENSKLKFPIDEDAKVCASGSSQLDYESCMLYSFQRCTDMVAENSDLSNLIDAHVTYASANYLAKKVTCNILFLRVQSE